jgi:hypothetical protein
MTTNKTAPAAVTLEQVKAKLAEVAEQISEGDAKSILRNSGGLHKAGQTIEDVAVKKYGRIIRKCEAALKARQDKLDKADVEQAAHEKAVAEIEADGLIVRSLAEKINRQELVAANSYIKEIGEADTFKAELGKKLIEVKPKCKAAGMTFDQFKEEYVGDLYERSKIFELMKVARGEITFDQIRQIESKKKRKQRAAAKASGTSTTSRTSEPAETVRTATGDKLDTSTLGPKVAEQLAKHMAGNDVDTEASAEVRKQAMGAEPTVESPPTQPEPIIPPAKPGEYRDTPEKKSKRVLMSGKSWLDENLTDMTKPDKAELFEYFKFHAAMVGVGRKAA